MPLFEIETPHGTLEIEHDGDPSELLPAVQKYVRDKSASYFASNLQTLATSPEVSSIPVSDAITQQNQFYESTRLPGQPALIPGTVAPTIAEVHAEGSKPVFGTIPYLPEKYENLISKIPTVTGIDNATMSRALIDTANFFQSAEGIGTAFIGAAPAAVRNIAGYLFAGMALKNAPETVRNWVNAKTEQEKRQAGAQMIETGLMLTPLAEAGLHGRIPTEVLKHTDAVPSDVLKEAAKEPSYPEVADAARNELGKRAEQLYQDVSPVLTDFDGPTQDTIRGAIEKQGRGEDLSIPERQAVQAARDLASTKAAANAPISTRPPSPETASPAGRAAVPPSPSDETTRLAKDAQAVAPETAKALTLFHGSDRPIESLSIPETLSENKGDLRGHVKAAFLTADESLAKTYSQIKAGPEGSAVVTKFTASPDAKILREGSPEFAQLEIEASKISGENQVVRRAAFIVNEATKRGWDAVHFKDEGNLGVVVTNPEAFSPAVEPAERTGWPAKPQAAGEPVKGIELFHGTRGDLKSRLIGVSKDNPIHLGTTQEQAEAFHKTGIVSKVVAKISNPAKANRDANWSHNALDALDALSGPSNPFPSTEPLYWEMRTRIEESKEPMKVLLDQLEKMGFDSIQYPNEVEGTGDSFMVWDKEKIETAPSGETPKLKGVTLYREDENGARTPVISGPIGETHADLVKRLTQPDRDAHTLGEIKHGFETTSGDVLDRRQAADQALKEGRITEDEHAASMSSMDENFRPKRDEDIGLHSIQLKPEVEAEAPDFADLSDYILQNHPQFFDATKYLDPSAQYKAHLSQWERDGRPDISTTELPKGGEPSAKEPDQKASPISPKPVEPADTQAAVQAQEGDTRAQAAEVRKTVSAYATKIGGSMGKMIEAVLNQGKSVEEAKADTGFIGDAQAAVDKAKRYLAAVKKVEPLAERSFKEEPTGEKVESPEMEQLKSEAEQDKGTGGGTMTRRILPGELGAVPKGTKELLETPELIRNTVKDITDSVGVQSIPKSSRAGIAPSVIQHASSRLYVPRLVDDLLSRVFPDSYKDGDAMAKTMDIINKDNVLGGYDAIIKKMTDALEAGDDKTAREAEQEANQIERAHDMNALARDVESAKNDPQISANIARWEKEVVPLMDSLYNEMKNVDPDTPRETRGRFFGARVNLLPENLAEQMKQWTDPSKPLPETPVSNFRNPNVKRDQFARKATLTGSYSTDANLVLLNSFGRRWNEVTKLRMYNDIVEKGVGEFVEPGTPPPDKLKGEKVGRLAVKVPETNPETGKTSMVEKSLYVQKQLVPELRNALDTDMKFTPHPIFKAITNLQLFQLADASAHIKNIHSVIVNALGRSAAWKDLVTKIPALGSIDAVTEITKVAREISADSPEIRREIAEMAKSGMVRPDYPATGLQKITRMQELIHDVDTAARVIMNRRFNNLVDAGIATDTPMNRRNFVQQIGEYNARLMGRYERAFRDIGLSPFIVAGRTFNRFSRRLITGNPGFEATDTAGAVKARAMQMSGLVAAATIPAFVNMFTTGTPFGRPGTPIGAVDLGPQFDTEDGKRRGIDVMNLVGIRRGLRSTGINAAIEGLRQGKTPNQIAGDAANDIITTATHPWIGPGLGAVSQVLTGKRLDLRSGWDIVESKKVGGAGQYLENARVALRQQNPFLYGLFSEKLGTDEGKTVAQQIVSGLLKSPLSAIGYKEFNTPAVAFAKSIPTMGQITPSKDERFKLLKQIEQTRKTDPAKANEMLSHAFADDKLTVADLKSNRARITKPDYLSRKVARLSPQESVDVFRLATKEERQMIGVQVLHKITNATSLPRSEMKQLIDDYKKIAATPAQPDPKISKR